MRNQAVFALAVVGGIGAVVATDSGVQAAAIRSIPGIEGVAATPTDEGCWIASGPSRILKTTCTGDRFMNIPLDVRADDAASTTKTIRWFGRTVTNGTSTTLLCVHPVSYSGNGVLSQSLAEICGSGPKSATLTTPTNGTALLSVRANLNTVTSAAGVGIVSTNSTE